MLHTKAGACRYLETTCYAMLFCIGEENTSCTAANAREPLQVPIRCRGCCSGRRLCVLVYVGMDGSDESRKLLAFLVTTNRVAVLLHSGDAEDASGEIRHRPPQPEELPASDSWGEHVQFSRPFCSACMGSVRNCLCVATRCI